MKKIFLIAVLCVSLIGFLFANFKETRAVNSELTEANIDVLQTLFQSYYNDGVYVKDTVINVNDDVKDEIQYFHANVNDLERTTYYNGNELWFSTGSGYGTNGENLTHFIVEDGVKSSETVLSNLPGMEAYYCTLNDFVLGTHTSAHNGKVSEDSEEYKTLDLTKGWQVSSTGIYSCTNEDNPDVIDAFRLFTAPLWLGKTAENANYITYTKATVEEVESSLVMKLWISLTDAQGKLVQTAETDGTNCVFSQAVIQPLSIWDGSSVSESLEGEGTEESPYLIQSGADLAYVKSQGDATTAFAGEYLKMTKSIYVKKSNFMITYMSGSFDGNGYSIRELNINHNAQSIGFIRQVTTNGTVKNLSIYGTVKGANYTGGIVGKAEGSIINCHNYANVSTIGNNDYAGGIAGASNTQKSGTCIIKDCTNNGEINGYQHVGGIVGSTIGNTEISNCLNNGNVTGGYRFVGGIAGTLYLTSNVRNCVNNGEIEAPTNANVGGIVGACGGTSISIISDCVNNGRIFGKTTVGGIIGYSATSKKVTVLCNNVNNGVVKALDGGVTGDIAGKVDTKVNIIETHDYSSGDTCSHCMSAK